MEHKYIIFIVALSVVLVASLIEALWLGRTKSNFQYDWKAAGVSFFDLIGRQAISLINLSIASPVFTYLWENRLMTMPLPSLTSFVILFFGQEFFYYWYHRAAHTMRWFWATHAVHHSPNQLTLASAYRLGWTGRITGTTIFFAPMALIGFHPDVIVGTLSLNLLYQFWIHATWIPKLGFLEGILNTPSSHRVHHASNLEYLDGNYGGVLVIFDRIFGTYIPERDDIPCKYGLVHPITSYNLLKIEFDQWLSLFKDIISTKGLLAKVKLLIKPPGWNPYGPGETTEELRMRNSPDKAY